MMRSSNPDPHPPTTHGRAQQVGSGSWDRRQGEIENSGHKEFALAVSDPGVTNVLRFTNEEVSRGARRLRDGPGTPACVCGDPQGD